MKTIIVDDNYFQLMQLDSSLSALSQLEVCGAFTTAGCALHFACGSRVELAFIKIALPDMDGKVLATELRRLHSGIVIIFLSDNGEEIFSTIGMDADYFLLRPYTQQSIEKAVNRASIMMTRQKKRVFIKTFGSFGVFVDGRPLNFSSSKALELLAYLVDRNGNVVNTREGFSVLWEDKSFCSSSASCYRKVLSRMLYTLEDAGVADIISVYTRGRSINRSKVDCDYFSYLDGNKTAIKGWNGEYMTNYSWGEPTLGWLREEHRRLYAEL